MFDFWSVNNIAFKFLEYPLSYIELFGTIFYLWSVWLITKKDILTWPVGIISVLLYMALFYQIRLYADTLEQIYYLIISIYGWWQWNQPQTQRVLRGRYSPAHQLIPTLIITILVAIALGKLMTQVHLLLPAIFPEPASFPYLDALTTIMSFTAMALMTQKRIESWFYWIIVDIIGIGLYFQKDVRFIALLYLILLFMSINGLLSWHKSAKNI